MQDATLAFAPGTIHAVLGENGSGKSTLLKLLSGVVAPSAGRILRDGREVRASGPAAFRRIGIGTVFQEVLVAPDRSVTDNVLLGCDGLLWREIPRGRREAVAMELLGRLTDRRFDPRALCRGLDLPSRQLVVIARALALAPRILLLDEITAALDHAERDRVFAFMQGFAAGGGLILFITHRMDEVARLAQRVTILRNGRIVQTLAGDAISAAAMLALMAPAAAPEPIARDAA